MGYSLILNKNFPTDPISVHCAIKGFIYPILLLVVIFASAFNLMCKRETAEKEINNQRLVRKNLFLNQTQFQIKKPYVFQYGTLQVDGPDGGMLYRFNISLEAFDWLVTKWNLEPREVSPPINFPH